MIRTNKNARPFSCAVGVSTSARKRARTEPLPDVAEQFDHLDEFGYQVIERVLSADEVEAASAGFDDWLVRLNTGIDLKVPATWTGDRWPRTLHGIVEHPCIAHEQFIWDIRQNANVYGVFASLWKDPALHTSFDRACIMKPPEETKQWRAYKPWPHIDQGPGKRGRHCVQGLVPVCDMNSDDGTLFVLKNSHRYHDAFFDAHPAAAAKAGSADWYKMSDDEYKWYLEQDGVEPFRVSAKAGDVVLWDSRTVHCNTNPLKGRLGGRWRKVVYVCMTPASATPASQLVKKVNAVKENRATSHWPGHVKLFPKKPRTYGTPFPEYAIAVPRPLLTPTGRRLAGLDSWLEDV